MNRVLVSGYGVMTRGILPHIASAPDTSVALLSRHQTVPPCPGVTVTALEDAPALRPHVILGCFENDERSQDFWTSPAIRRSVEDQGSCCIEISTLSIDRIAAWHDEIRLLGGTSVESPVTGSRPGAASGVLSAFVYESGKDPRATAVMDTFVRKRYEFTAPGNPTAFKLVYNAWGAAMLHTLAAFVPTLHSHLGADFDIASDIVTSDGWMSLVCASRLGRMMTKDYGDPDFALAHMVKDLRYAHDILGDSNALLNLVYEQFTAALASHGGHVDYTAVTEMGMR
ncbi:NAD-binding protein [Streptomyces canus]|uniref:NAD-binding protein n=1 Tax=Streptomyces canus TaxID=58343 RepID=UPI0022515D7F|nr:NAD-binding protein [Streptomyces canus]MCX5256832.1 NAD-binding protein [Streptomyces canus]